MSMEILDKARPYVRNETLFNNRGQPDKILDGFFFLVLKKQHVLQVFPLENS